MLLAACKDTGKRYWSRLDRSEAWVGVFDRSVGHTRGTPLSGRVTILRDRPGVDVGGLATMDIQGLATGGPASDRQYSVGAARLGAGWARKTMGGRAPAGQSTGPRGTVEGAAARLTLSDVMPMPTWPVPATDRWASAPGQ
jgi:hypothetical protein